MQFRKLAIVALLLAILLVSAVHGGHVCQNKDCSDIVPEALVRDNLGKSHHFHQAHHDDWKEEARVRRIEILRRERDSL